MWWRLKTHRLSVANRIRKEMQRLYGGRREPAIVLPPEPDRTDPWASNDWQHTLVTPVFVGGPADGHRDEPRPRHALPLRIEVPVQPLVEAKMSTETQRVELRNFNLGSATYRLGLYRDAFTVEYR